MPSVVMIRAHSSRLGQVCRRHVTSFFCKVIDNIVLIDAVVSKSMFEFVKILFLFLGFLSFVARHTLGIMITQNSEASSESLLMMLIYAVFSI